VSGWRGEARQAASRLLRGMAEEPDAQPCHGPGLGHDAPDPSAPKARQSDLLVQRLSDETVVYDLKRHRGHCLNHAAALVWAACDGASSPASIARRVSRELGTAVDQGYVRFALGRLARAHLLESDVDPGPRISRATWRGAWG